MSITLSDDDIVKLRAWNQTGHNYPDLTLVQLLESQLEKTPNATAVSYKKECLTYFELHKKANQWAHFLREKGVKRNVVVAVCLPRSLELVIALLAVLKAGGAYLPIDVKQPLHRIRVMLENSRSKVCITHTEYLLLLQEQTLRLKLLTPTIINRNAASYVPTSLVNQNAPEDLSYIIYTSGSTGAPKGVANVQRGTVNRLMWMQGQFQLTTADRVLQKTSLSFDVAVWEFWWPLMCGAHLVLATQQAECDFDKLCDCIVSNAITIIHFVPSQLSAFLAIQKLRECYSLRIVIVSGEMLTKIQMESFFQQSQAELYNLYGPTEASIDVSYFHCIRNAMYPTSIPIGRPIANTQLYVLDEQHNLVPVGVEGELYITGIGLAQGYLQDEELTEQRFFNISPFANQCQRAYKTGDLVRWLPDGNLTFICRKDEQLKIRGFRIEPSEIKIAILNHPAIADAVVIGKLARNQQLSLVAYVVRKKAVSEISWEDLQRFLSAILPDYMVPQYWIWVNQLPLTLSGKVDHNQLPEPQWNSQVTSVMQECSEFEKKMITLWENVLGIAPIDVNDNFFSLGGDSLTAAIIASKARQQGQYLRPQWLLRFPTLNKLNDFIEKTNICPSSVLKRYKQNKSTKTIYHQHIEKLVKFSGELNIDQFEDIYPTTSVQKGIIFHTLLNPNSGIYTNLFCLLIKGTLNKKAFEQAWKILLQKHSILRTGFYFTDLEEPQQIVYRNCCLRYQFTDIQRMSAEKQQSLLEEYATTCQQDINLEQPPLWKIALFQLSVDTYKFFYIDHHAILDGGSQAALWKEVLHLYDSFIQKKSIDMSSDYPFVEYINWVIAQDKTRARDYWQQLLVSVEHPTIIDIDKKKLSQCYLNNVYNFYTKTISKDTLSSLTHFAKKECVTLNTVIQAAWIMLLARYQEDASIVYGLVESGMHSDMADSTERMGMFAQTFPVVINVDKKTTVHNLLQSVQRQIVDSSEQSHYSLVDMHALSHVPQPIPLFRYVITFLNEGVEHVLEKYHNDSLSFYNFIRQSKTHYPMTVIVIISQGQLNLHVMYDEVHFSKDDIDQFLYYWQDIFQTMVRSSNLPVITLPLSSISINNQLKIKKMCYDDYPLFVKSFEEQARQNSQKIALVFKKEKMTYGELNQRANQLAYYLKNNGVTFEMPIAVLLPRGISAIVCMLAVFKVGGCYFPMNWDDPSARLELLLSIAQPIVLISESSMLFHKKLSLPHQTMPFFLQELDEILSELPNANLNIEIKKHSLAYLLFTSGTTGQPKGVTQEHQTLAHLIFWQIQQYSDFYPKKITQIANMSFDVSLQEIGYALASGNELHIIPDEIKYTVTKLLQIIDSEKISDIFLPTSLLELFADAGILILLGLKYLKRIFVSGEALKISDTIKQFFIKYSHICLINQYGPTETHVVSSYTMIGSSAYEWPLFPPIGEPIDNTSFIILDQYQQPVPVGVSGELYISGVSLARCYWQNEIETNNKFIAYFIDPQTTVRVYRTGDKVKLNDLGQIEYLGRVDEQLKISGYRVEPAEIEMELMKIPGVKQCKLLAEKDVHGNQRLRCYIQGNTDLNVDRLGIRLQLAKKLPDYMVPDEIIFLHAFPFTYNGKIDTKSLLKMRKEPQEVLSDSSPLNSYEADLLVLCSHILDISDLKPIDNFFIVGTNSLLLIRLLLALEKAFKVRLTLADILLYPSVRMLSQKINQVSSRNKSLGLKSNSPHHHFI